MCVDAEAVVAGRVVVDTDPSEAGDGPYIVVDGVVFGAIGGGLRVDVFSAAVDVCCAGGAGKAQEESVGLHWESVLGMNSRLCGYDFGSVQGGWELEGDGDGDGAHSLRLCHGQNRWTKHPRKERM